MTVGAVYCVYDDHEYLEASLESIIDTVDKVLILISDVPWNGLKSDNSSTKAKAKELCANNKKCELIEGHWTNEVDQRNYGLDVLYKNGIDYCLVIDADEIYHKQHLLNLFAFAQSNISTYAFHIEWNTYWKKSYYRIHPREAFRPLVLVKISNFVFTDIRVGITGVIRNIKGVFRFEEPYKGLLVPNHLVICYHMSYSKTDEWMKRKLETNSHAKEFIPNWYDNVWVKWKDGDKNLHPVTPQQYATAIKDDYAYFPDALKRFIRKENRRRLCSIIILNWNSKDLLLRCVELIRTHTNETYEIIIVDNGSTEEGTKEVLDGLGCSKVIYNKENLGFAGGVNVGIRATKGTNVCLMNVDAEPQEGWLEELYKTSISYPNAGLIGPLGNQVASGWQAKGMIDKDMIAPNLMGFCMLIMREVIDKIGFFDERFKIGCYEDNDYGMRAMIAGYTLMISAKSLVIHEAHQVFKKNNVDSKDMELVNKDVFMNKIYTIMMSYAQTIDVFQHQDAAKKFQHQDAAKKLGIIIE